MANSVVNVVVTREEGENNALISWLPAEVVVHEVPLTSTTYRPLESVRSALRALPFGKAFHSLVITSRRSATYAKMALDDAVGDVEVFSVGPATTASLSAEGVNVHSQGDSAAVSLAPRISRGPVVVLGAAGMRGELAEALRAKDLEVALLTCYETIGVTLNEIEKTTLRGADVIFIGAPSAWSVVREYVPDRSWVVVPGTSTAAVVLTDHQRVLEGWGPHLAETLRGLST
jgi:uroporphyrinogen-III synthase